MLLQAGPLTLGRLRPHGNSVFLWTIIAPSSSLRRWSIKPMQFLPWTTRTRLNSSRNIREAKEKIFMLRAYEGAPVRRAEIRDPYYGDLEQTRECYRLLQNCIQNVASGVLRSLASEPPLSPADSANVNENLNFSTRHMLVTPFGAAPEILAPLWKVKIITDSELRSIRHSLRRDLLSSDDAAED